MLNLKEYTSMAGRTECDYGVVVDRLVADNRPLRLAHHALGVASEFEEMLQAKSPENAVEELGDIMWFSAGAASVVEFDLSTIPLKADEDVSLLSGMAAVCRLSDAAKAPLVYGREINKQQVIDALVGVVQFVLATCEVLEIPMEKIYTANIKKLQARYPEKFTDFHANNRDTDKEFEAISEVIVVQQ